MSTDTNLKHNEKKIDRYIFFRKLSNFFFGLAIVLNFSFIPIFIYLEKSGLKKVPDEYTPIFFVFMLKPTLSPGKA